MPYKTNSILLCHNVTVGAERGNHYRPLTGYEPNNEQQSVYSSQSSIPLVRSVGHCPGCNGDDRELVNGYCEACRVMGANERQCLNAKLIQRRSETGRNNSAGSCWRYTNGRKA